ncbi:MAG: hypothetical protein Q7S74_06135 [Nanoarchaeota archaeon]|nr:hypothetical protein [Nanoarchaeota archaeon]
MVKQKPTLILKREGNEYRLTETRLTFSNYLGRVYYLINSSKAYAIIYDREMPALSGPPLRQQVLLESGFSEEESSLNEILYSKARQEAETLATKLGLNVVENLSPDKIKKKRQ